MTTPARGRIKGTAIIEGLRWHRATYGRENLAHVIANFPRQVAVVINTERDDLGLLPSAWYPSEVVHALLDNISKELSPDEQARRATRMAHAVMEKTLRGVYKMLFHAIATPTLYARYVQRLWSAFYDTGTVEMWLPTPTSAVGKIRGWAGHHPFLCQISHASSSAIFTAMGCRNVHTDGRCYLQDGGDACVGTHSWER